MIHHTSLPRMRQNMKSRVWTLIRLDCICLMMTHVLQDIFAINPQKIPHSSPWWASYGVSFVRILKEVNHIITAPRCIWDPYLVIIVPIDVQAPGPIFCLLLEVSNLAYDWLSIVWAYSEQETENGPRSCQDISRHKADLGQLSRHSNGANLIIQQCLTVTVKATSW